MNKTGQSCLWSIEMLLSESKVAYLWTFTFAECLSVSEACYRWQVLQRDLVRDLGFKGVRVYELHPNGHGLHIHVVTASRYLVRAVRHISNCRGFGRIHVKPLPASASGYVAKYLSKAKRAPELKGRRLWACLGFSGAKVRDCVIDNALTRQLKLITPDHVKKLYASMNWALPSSAASINFARFIIAQGMVASAEYSLSVASVPVPASLGRRSGLCVEEALDLAFRARQAVADDALASVASSARSLSPDEAETMYRERRRRLELPASALNTFSARYDAEASLRRAVPLAVLTVPRSRLCWADFEKYGALCFPKEGGVK